jgi:hypothetical protein
MANRLYNQFGLALEKSVVCLYGQFTVAAAGAPTLVAAKSKGIASVVRNSAGNYTITLQDTYIDLLMLDVIIQNATAPAAPSFRIVSQTVSAAATKAIVIQFATSAGTATDPGSGERILFAIDLKNSTAY